MDAGIMGVIPALNFRETEQLSHAVIRLRQYQTDKASSGSFGVNLIVQGGNKRLGDDLQACVDARVPFYITSLGDPAKVIKAAHAYGALVYCDVTRMDHARKCAEAGCDGFIAVGQGAGGHAGPFPLQVLVPALRERFPGIPVVAAGGIATGSAIVSVMALGAAGVSMGTRFIACSEAMVPDEYKEEIIRAGMQDIVLSTRLSGVPASVINTEYVRKSGTSPGFFERWLSGGGWLNRYVMKRIRSRRLKRILNPGHYGRIWSAGQSVEMIGSVASVREIVDTVNRQMEEAYGSISRIFGNR
jgi:nitronate monooxygenase